MMKWGQLIRPFFILHILSFNLLPDQLSNIRTDLDKFAIHAAADVEAFANEWFSAKRSVEKFQGVANPVAKKWQAEDEEEEEDQGDYKSKARDFVKLHSFLIEAPTRGLEPVTDFKGVMSLKHPWCEPCQPRATPWV